MKANRRKVTNAIGGNFLARMLVMGFLGGLAALFFVYLKNQQHAIGDQTRRAEAEFHEYGARNQALEARITAMTSRGYLQRRVDEGYIRLEAVRDTAVARVTPAVPAEPDGVLRTASRDSVSGIAAGAPQRVMKR